MIMTESYEKLSKVVLSDVKNTDSIDFLDIDLRKWHYIMIKVIITLTFFDFFCLDIECKLSMINRSYFFKLMSNYKSKIKTTNTSIEIWKIEKLVIVFNESIKKNIDISEFLNEKSITTRKLETFYIMNDLSVLDRNKYKKIETKRMIIDFKKLTIESCQNVSIELTTINFFILLLQ